MGRVQDQAKESPGSESVVLRIDETDEPDWKSIAKAAQGEAASLGKQLAEALKKLNTESAVEPCFAVVIVVGPL